MKAIRGRFAYREVVGLIHILLGMGLVVFPTLARTQPAPQREFVIDRSIEGREWRLKVSSLRILGTPVVSGGRGVTLKDASDVLWGLKVVVTSKRTDWKPGALFLSTNWFLLHVLDSDGKSTARIPEGTKGSPGNIEMYFYAEGGRTEWELDLLFATPPNPKQVSVGFLDLLPVPLLRDGVVAPLG